ncbi:hypothetical protein BH09BAC3_BH09BAC3_20340 [soil metagenome]
MKDLETINMVEMNKSEMEGTSGGFFGRGTKDLAFIIYYVTVELIPYLAFG